MMYPHGEDGIGCFVRQLALKRPNLDLMGFVNCAGVGCRNINKYELQVPWGYPAAQHPSFPTLAILPCCTREQRPFVTGDGDRGISATNIVQHR